MITHLEPDILECEDKWALGSITTNKASGGNGIPVGLFQTLKDDGCESTALNMPANLENSAVTTGLEKVVFIPICKKGNAKECSNYHTIALISHTSKLMLKNLQARLQQYMNSFQMFNLVLEKAGKPEIKLPSSTATAAKSLQSCPTLCDPIDGSPPGSPVPGILQASTLEWIAISFSNA